jgi:cytoskeletal protein CcmA (bactofilin family)
LLHGVLSFAYSLHGLQTCKGNTVDKARRQAVIGPDLFIKGDVRNGDEVVVLGFIEGSLTAQHVIVRNGGRIHGSMVANSAEIEGEVQGDILVRQLIQISSTGSVRGEVHYGRLTMQAGAELSADMRNVPPAIAGDLNLTVKRGQLVRITPEDLIAIDPDSPAQALVFAVSKPLNGFVARASASSMAVEQFSQSELLASSIVFVHDGAAGPTASFDVVVTDDAGATSGAAQTVHVAVF